ncbi:Fur-regulated basic protein FbpA [Virgibacillus dakarensis]|uniref:Fur-regulated basic protein FbpA n=1 Tax=Lentibacillus populi TaxID=1827502 RepID=A0A9W5TV64_9BACI|nr:Fur-regulated basic protein FbpA [Virgibacillus dakarensis]MTW85024.1 Fur-regulated basic protein FbpA [Virgibacillus dakarensis]GGB34153.1 hypothetical protein GCM10011409_09490 [Lentibacillus populi]
MKQNQLRKGIDELKQFYIRKLRDANVLNDSDKDPSSLTLSELANMYKFYQL